MVYEKQGRYIIPFDDVPADRAPMPEISVDERRNNFVEIETGFPEETAIREAKRCLSCRRCLGCALCWAECKPEAIDFSLPDETLELAFDEVVLTCGQDNAFCDPDPELGFGRYADVLTDLQFERMLSPTGPTDGLALSPLDGRIPGHVAIVQDGRSADDPGLPASLILGVNMAQLCSAQTQGVKVTLISPLSDEFKARYESQIRQIAGLTLIEGTPLSAGRENDSDPLNVAYTSRSDEKVTIAADLVVILTRPATAAYLRDLARQLDTEPPAF